MSDSNKSPNSNKTSSTSSQQGLPFNWPVVSMLLFLTGIPGIPAIVLIILVLLGSGAGDSMQSIVNPLHLETPAAILVHGGSGVLFFLTMPFQFSPRVRKKHTKWHRTAGMVATLSAFVMAISGVWMHHVLSPEDLGMRYFTLVIMSLAICMTFTLGLMHIFRRNIEAHRKWMARGVAVALAAVTPLFVDIIITLGFSHHESALQLLQQLQHDYGRILAIVINLSILELVRYRKDNRAEMVLEWR